MQGAEFPVRAVLDDRGIDQLIAALTKAGKTANMTEQEIEEMNAEVRKVGREGPKEISKFNQSLNNMAGNTLKKVGAAVLAAFAVDRLLSFGKEVIRLTAEMQKFEAVLTNTLGSRSAARIAMREILEFASKTPFAVNEITDAYVRLANRGFNPTVDQLRQIGDLAASQGKSFTQLVEAILDGQTMEFERLKEFGIKARQTNDTVVFSFKGVRTEVEKNEQAIQDYLLSLGDVEGVMGGMAAISGTLGGQLSNLNDSWETFMRTLGDGQSGPLSNAVKNLNLLLSIATEWLKTDAQRLQDRIDEQSKTAIETVKSLEESYGDINRAAEEYLEFLQLQLDIQYKYNASLSRLDDANNEEIENSYQRITVLKGQIQAINDYVAAAQKKEEVDGNDNNQQQLGLIEKLNKRLTELRTKRQEAFDENDIYLINQEIKRTQDEIKRLEGLAGFDKITKDVKELKAELELAGAFKNFERSLQAFRDAYAKNQQEINKLDAEARREREEAQQYAKETQIAAIQGVLDFRAKAVDQEINMLNRQRQYQLENAGNNEQAKLEINRKFDAQQAQLMRKQAQRQQQAALFQLAINQGPAIAKTLGTLGMPAAIPFLAAVATLFALQLQNTRSQQPPRFAKGVFRLKGPGTETSDSIPAYLSKNESVIPANRSTGIFAPVVESLIKGSDEDVMRAMKLQLRGDLFNPGRNDSASKELIEVNRNLQRLLKKETFHLGIDEYGFKKWTEKGNYITNIMARRYHS